jgi:hypothetical protein
MEQTVPLEIAAQHYMSAMYRGQTEGIRKERDRIYDVLKKNGQYQALLLLKQIDQESKSR